MTICDTDRMPVVYRVKVGLLCHAWREDVVPSLVHCIRFSLNFVFNLTSTTIIITITIITLGGRMSFPVLSTASGSILISLLTLSPTSPSHWSPNIIWWAKGRQPREAETWWGWKRTCGTTSTNSLTHSSLAGLPQTFAPSRPSSSSWPIIFCRYASCDVWHMSKDKRRYTLHIYIPSRYRSSRYIPSGYIPSRYIPSRLFQVLA